MGCMDERKTKRVVGKEGRVNNSEFRGPYAGDECVVGNNFIGKGVTREKERVYGKKTSHTLINAVKATKTITSILPSKID